MFLERLIKYYDFNNESRSIVKVANWLDKKSDKYERYDIRYWFWYVLLMAFVFPLAFGPQFIAYPYYWIVLLRYPVRICTYEFDNFYDINEDIEIWHRDNGVKMICLFRFFTEKVLLMDPIHTEKFEFAFRHESDAMAFKLRWT